MRVLPVFALAVMSIFPISGADAPSIKFYKLNFVVKEVDAGKTISSHSYSLSASTDQGEPYSIRIGSKVPSIDSSGKVSYFDLGTNFDVRNFKDLDGEIALRVSADVSSIVEDTVEKGRGPVIRMNRWSSAVSAKVGKPTVIFSSDDLSSKRQMTVELTATPIH